MVIHRPIGPRPGPVAKVVRPAVQDPVQPVSHLRPRARVAWDQDVTHLLSKPRHTLVGRASAQIPPAILPSAVGPKGVPQKVKTLRASFLELGLRVVQGQSQAGHRLPRPVSRLFGMLPREDHKVVRVVDDLRLKDLSPFGDPPILQEPIQVQVSKQWTYDPTLWSSAGLDRRYAGLPIASVPGAGWCPRKPRHTTHHQHLPEKVTIVRVRHPFEGRSLNVLGVTHRKGQLHLVLILPDGSKSLIPAVWTDLALPIQLGSPPRTPTLGSLEDLLHARAVVDALLGRLAPATREDGNCPAKKESALARKKSKPLRSSARRNRRLGNRARGTPSSRHPDPGAADRPGCSTKPREGEEP